MKPKQPIEHCDARNRSGGTCRKPAGWGTQHLGTGRCRLHGGASPIAELNGVIELASREANTLGRPLPIHPHDAILRCIEIAAGEVQYASERIALTPEDKLMVMTAFGPATDAWVSFRQKAMDRLVAYAQVAAKVGVEERRVQLAEQHGQQIARVIRAILLDLGVNPDSPATRDSVRKQLTLVAGEG